MVPGVLVQSSSVSHPNNTTPLLLTLCHGAMYKPPLRVAPVVKWNVSATKENGCNHARKRIWRYIIWLTCYLCTKQTCCCLGIVSWQLGPNSDCTMGVLLCLLQDAQDMYLEQQRELTLTQKILVIQKTVRSWHCRRRFLRMRKCIVTLQSHWRAYSQRHRFLKVERFSGV